MLKFKKISFLMLLTSLSISACVIPLTSCQPLYIILRNVDYGNKEKDDGTKTPANSRMIDATNSLLYYGNYDFTWSTLPENAPTPQKMKMNDSKYYAHLLLESGKVAYTVKVTASIIYQGHSYEESITLIVKAEK